MNIRTEISLALPFVLVGCMESSPVPTALGSVPPPSKKMTCQRYRTKASRPRRRPRKSRPSGCDGQGSIAIKLRQRLRDPDVTGWQRVLRAHSHSQRRYPGGHECGEASWISEPGIGNRSVDLSTGFFENTRAVAYGSQVRLRDPGGSAVSTGPARCFLRTSW